MESISNVCIFVLDSLRWDYLPPVYRERGVVFKTVAQSLFSAPSFATLSTGVYPQEHGVADWGDAISSSVETIYELEGVDGGFYQDGDPSMEGIFDVLKQSTAKPLDSLSPPFVYLERDCRSHTPFAGYPSVEAYFEGRKRRWGRIASDYYGGIYDALDVFERRVEQLREDDLLDETLIILTSDHGELIGDYGDVGHSSPACPEVALVPTVFVHPDLNAEHFYASPDDEIVEHVDVIATALAAAGIEKSTSGVDLLSRPRTRDWGYNRVELSRRGHDFYVADSAWWPDSGYAFARNSAALRALFAVYRTTRSAGRHSVRWNLPELLTTYLPSNHSFGTPPVSQSEADRLIGELTDEFTSNDPDEATIDDGTEQRLKELGYLDT